MRRHGIARVFVVAVLAIHLRNEVKVPSATRSQSVSSHWGRQERVPTASIPYYCGDSITGTASPDSVCRCLSHWAATLAPHDGTGLYASDIWTHYEPTIRQAALESTRVCWWPKEFAKLDLGRFHSFTKDLYANLDVYRMKRSLKTPANPLVAEKVLEVILRRRSDPVNNPPLKIAVFGGSVTQGCWSLTNTYGLYYPAMKCPPECTWTTKLEHLLNAILGNNTVVVRNYGMGGTDSDYGSVLIEYNLWPDKQYSSDEFDIVVAAYSTNEAKSPPEMQEVLRESWQRFVRLAMDQRPCSDLPLVIQLEDNMMDYIANDVVHGGLWHARDMFQTAAWAGIMSVSYADATRDFVYANTSKKLLGEYKQIHPGQGFHTGISWVMAWNLLNALIDSCDAKLVPQYNNAEPRVAEPLPVLTTELRSSEVESLWRGGSKEKSRLCSGKRTEVKCLYNWVAAMHDTSTKEAVAKAMSLVLKNNTGWKAVGFPVRHPRRTWLGEGPNSAFTIQLDDLSTPIDRMLVLYLKSYGKQWLESRVLLVVEGAKKRDQDHWEELHRDELEGTHGTKTSVNYSYRIKLGDYLQAGNSVRATFTLVGGNRFQVNGLALCWSSAPVPARAGFNITV